jgi:hypothetical protein
VKRQTASVIRRNPAPMMISARIMKPFHGETDAEFADIAIAPTFVAQWITNLLDSFIHLLIHSFIRFIRSLVDPFIGSLIRSFISLLIHALINLFVP